MPEELTINEQKKNMSVSGTVDSVIYSSEETGYTVCLLESEGECVTVVGTLPYLTEGDRITAYGSFVNHPAFSSSANSSKGSCPKRKETFCAISRPVP